MGRDNEHNIYKSKWACLRCRKCFKQRSCLDMSNAERASIGERRIVLCPQCGNHMINMGWDFKVPRQADTEQWRKVEQLAQNGIFFHAQEHSANLVTGPGPRPRRLRDVEEFIKAEQSWSSRKECPDG